ncbi:hypothetical protein GCM10010218_42540 [Streptomyces mashuensis]|uniref:DUF397 domain-containing protein n=1 Tax=Streptomyces mashuensis TaxID=33904 RepID=A0A919B5V0_9ACTN|nr:DUF397 domain-containing protein [Streptomyces mashuensis]GHF56686.1 hypothetical protein GCM10010218_42540 [Streptomyces mashuensis]
MTRWQKSSRPGADAANRLEVAATGPSAALRESDDPTVVITTRPAALRALTRHLQAARFARTATRFARAAAG